MKLNIDYRSIKFKTCVYFILFAAVILAAIWMLQVFMLNHYYSAMKTKQTNEVASEIKSYYKHHDLDAFLEKVENVSDSYDMYIYVASLSSGEEYYRPDGDNVSRLPGSDGSVSSDEDHAPHQYANEIPKLTEKMLKSKNYEATMKLNGTDRSQQVLGYGGILSAKGKESLVVFLFSPLWPMSSTIQILKSNLIWVSVIALFLACLISFYMSVRISRPIRKIDASAKRMANGEYGIVFKGGHYTELSNLADTLTKASIELEKTDMIQKDLIANVSHDLRTPLTMIKSYAEMIRDLSGDNPVKREKHLQVIMDEADRLNGLVEDMLTISRLQSGKLVLEPSEFNLTETIQSILNTYRVMEVEDTYTFNFNCNTDYYVCADMNKIKQVISNFITNALKFCGEDKVVNVSLMKLGRTVELSVEDHGPGIAPDEIGHVWERYYRSSSNMVRATEGSGLGLSICKEILTLHKVEFGVESTLGKGTRFWFELPVVRKGTYESSPEEDILNGPLVPDSYAVISESIPDAEITRVSDSENETES